MDPAVPWPCHPLVSGGTSSLTSLPLRVWHRIRVTEWSTGKLQTTLRCGNLLNGIAMLLAGSLSLVTNLVSVSFSSVTVAAYMGYVPETICNACVCHCSAVSPANARGGVHGFSRNLRRCCAHVQIPVAVSPAPLLARRVAVCGVPLTRSRANQLACDVVVTVVARCGVWASAHCRRCCPC